MQTATDHSQVVELIFDCHSGISGDRLLAAFCGVGADPRKLYLLARRLGLRGVTITYEAFDDGSGAFKPTVRIDRAPGELRLSSDRLYARVEHSGLSRRGVIIGRAILSRLLEEQAAAIGLPVDQVELSGDDAVEALLTIVGGIALWADLGTPRITVAGEVAIGGAAAPAVERLLDGVPTLNISDELQLTTAAAAAFLGYFFDGPPSSDGLVIRQALVPMGSGDGIFRGRLIALLCQQAPTTPDEIELS